VARCEVSHENTEVDHQSNCFIKEKSCWRTVYRRSRYVLFDFLLLLSRFLVIL